MASKDKIRSHIKVCLPGAEEGVIEGLVTTVEQELGGKCNLKKGRRRVPKTVIEQIIRRSELSALGLYNE